MAQPPQYKRNTDFAGDERNNSGGRSTVRTDRVNAELDALGTTANVTAKNLGLIQRDDGQVRDKVVTPASLSTATIAFLGGSKFNPRGEWTPLTLYARNDMVVVDQINYIALALHISALTFSADLVAGLWQRFVGTPDIEAELAAPDGAGRIGWANGGTFPAQTVGDRLNRMKWLADTATGIDASAIGLSPGDIVATRGLASATDQGGGEFTYSPTPAVGADGGMSVNPLAGGNLTRRWSRAVRPEFFGAIGDGSPGSEAVDTAAFQKAFASGRSVELTERGSIYRVSAPCVFANNRQALVTEGAIVRPMGNIVFLTASGGKYGNLVRGVVFDGPLMSNAGTYLAITGANNFQLESLQVFGGGNFLDILGANRVVMRDLWLDDMRGAFVFRVRGTDAAPTNVVRLMGVEIGGNAGVRPDGILCEGLVHTLQLQAVSIVRPNRGLVAKALAGTTGVPEFFLTDDLEVDFPLNDGVRLEVGRKFAFPATTYLQGSANGSGIYVGSAVDAATTIIEGGFITGNARYGIENLTDVHHDGHTVFGTNGLGSVADTTKIVRARVPGIDHDATWQRYFVSGSPVEAFDTNDYFQYDRGNNSMNWLINNANVLNLNESGLVRFARMATATTGLPSGALWADPADGNRVKRVP